jgi:hypothetical protein
MSTRTWTNRLFARKPRTARPVTRPARRPLPARPCLEQLETRLVPTVSTKANFGGMIGASAPDTCGAVGPKSYVETVNHAVSIYDKSGNSIASTDMFSFFQNVGGLTGEAVGDATSCYDEPIGRFIVADLQVTPDGFGGAKAPSYLDICVSTSSNPGTLSSSDWHFYQMPTSEAGGLWSDYPGNFGYNQDALVVTFNMIGSAHSQIDALSQSDLAAHGSTLTVKQFDLNGYSYRPVTMHDSVAGGPMWFVQDGGGFGGGASTINLVRIDGLMGSSASATGFSMGVKTYGSVYAPLNPDNTAITPGPDGVPDTRILKAAEANNTIVACQIVGVGSNEDDARWYELNVSNINSPSVVDQGNVGFGAKTYTTYPGIDINAAGDIGMSVDRSGNDSANDYISVYVTGRTPADAAANPGQMETPVLMRAGDSNDHQGRQGDFSGINVDSDGTFWTANEFCTGGASGTQITHFQIADIGQAWVDGSGVLQVQGSNADDNVFLRPKSGDSSKTEVVNNGTVLGDFPNSSFTSINVNLLAGFDNVTLTDAGGTSGLGFFTAPVTVTGGSGRCILALDDSTSGSANTYTITSNSVSRNGFGGVTFTNVQDLDIADGTGTNTVNVLSTSANLTFDTNGQDSITVGNNGNVQGITGGMYIWGSGSASLSINDSADTTARTVTLSPYDTLTGLAPGVIQWVPTSSATGGVTGLTVDGGSGGNTFTVQGTSNFYHNTILSTGAGNDTVNVEATTGALAIANEGGQDSVYVGSNGSALGGNVQGIHGGVLVGGVGATALTVDDGGDTTARTATLSNAPFFGGFIGGVTGLAPASIVWFPTSSSTGGVTGLAVYGGSGGNTFTVTNTSNFFGSTLLNTGTGNDTVNVEGTTGTLTDYNPGGQDTTVVGSNGLAFGGNVQGINGQVYVYGPGGTILSIDDSGDSTGRTAALYDGAITGLAPANIYWAPTSSSTGGVIGLNVFGSSVASTYNVTATSNFFAYEGLQTGAGNDAVNITATTGGLYLYNLGGTDSVVVGSQAPATTGGTLAAIKGFVYVYGAGATNLTVDDSGDTLARTVTVTSAAVTGLGNPAPIDVAPGVSSLTINGSQGASTYTVRSTQAGTATTVNAGPANDTFLVGDATHPLSGIQGALTLNGGLGTNKVTLTDTAQSGNETYGLSTTAFSGGGMAGVSFSGMKGLTVNAGTGTVALFVTAVAPSLPVTFNGGGIDGLFGPNANNTWAITGTNAGKLTAATLTGTKLGTVAFNKVQYLFGNSVADLFKVSPGKGLSGYIQGGTGIETIDYSLWTTGVTVNLGTNTATNIAQGIYGVENINGGKGNDTLTGDALNNIIRGGGGNDTIVGGGGNDILIGGQVAANISAAGSGRSILIGGKSTVAQTLTGSTQDDIIIGGYTSYDSYSLANDLALLAILGEWTSGDSEATRESKIMGGVGPGGKDKFKLGLTVKGDGTSDTINGNGAEPGDTDWIINT